MLKTENAFLLA